MDRKNKFYIAAPFFNEVQKDLVASIELAFDMAIVDYFSPRHLDENKAGPLGAKAAAAIFRKDIQGLALCDSVLAVVDWKLPSNHHIRELVGGKELNKSANAVNVVFMSPPLNVPDSGTVFEMGAAYMRMNISSLYNKTQAFDPVAVCEMAADKLPGGPERSSLSELGSMLRGLQRALSPIRTVVFTERSPESGLNLMLTQGAAGVLFGLDSLKAFLKTGEPDWDHLTPWIGPNR